MSRYVVDASVAIKWYVPEVQSDAALHFYGVGFELSAPDLLFPEVGNILWKKVRRSQINRDEAFAILAAVVRSRIETHACGPLTEYAFEIANETGATFYDSMYLSLAAQSGSALVTADQRLFRRLTITRFSQHVRWVEDVP